MRRIRKWAAWAIVGSVLPVLADVATDPYADRSVPRSWCYGVAKLAGVGLFGWALRMIGAGTEDV